MSNKFRLRRWFFGKNRNNSLVRFVAKQCIKNIGHFNNEDRNHIRNGEFWLQNTLINHFSKNDKVPIVDAAPTSGSLRTLDLVFSRLHL